MSEELAFEFSVQLKPVRRTEEPAAVEEPPKSPEHHPLIRALVLAHLIESMTQEGKIKRQNDAAKWLGVSLGRVSQISNLRLLAPGIQEAILAASPERLASLTEKKLRPIAAMPDWDAQAALWAKL